MGTPAPQPPRKIWKRAADKHNVTLSVSAGEELKQRFAKELAHQVRYAWVMYVVFFVLFTSQSQYGILHPAAGWTSAGAMLFAGVYRTWCAQRLLHSSSGTAEAERLRFLRSVALHSVLWAASISCALWAVRGRGPLETAVIIAIAGFSSAGAGALAPNPAFAWIHVIGPGGAALVWAIWAQDRFGVLMVTLVAAFLGFVAASIAVQHRHVAGMVRSRLELELHGAELRRAKELAEEASSARATFLANMSHEIRTPLNGVLGLTQVLDLTSLTPEQRSLLDALRRSGDHLLAIVNDILDFSKINAGKLEIENVSFDLRTLIQDVAAPLQVVAEAKGLQWTLVFPPELFAVYQGDPVRIRQVLGNLLHNAVKFTESGEVRLVVERGQPGWMRFTVADTGIGVSAEQCKGLFRDFAQADASTTRRFGGSGLGLAISKRLADMMGGRLTVESERGKGSRFVFEIPLPRSENEKNISALSAALRQPVFQLPATWRILVAEDNPINRTIAERFLAGSGAAVDTVENGRAAVALHAARPYDLILMDCHMPEMDGFEATAAIRSQGAGADVPIIAVTASALPEDRQRCLAAGMNGHVSKPLYRAELLEAIAHAMRERASGSVLGPERPWAGESACPASDDHFARQVGAGTFARQNPAPRHPLARSSTSNRQDGSPPRRGNAE